MEKTIDSFEGYVSMYEFLNEIYKNTKGDTLGSILGDIEINPHDGKPMDPAIKDDWFDAVKNTFGDDVELFLPNQAFSIMIEFLRDMSTRILHTELKELIEYLESNQQDEIVYNNWIKAIDKVLEMYKDSPR